MIAKIIKGRDFARLGRYLTARDRGEVLGMRHLSSDDPEAAAQEMQVAASVSVRTQQPVMHIVVSYDPADGPQSDDQMRDDAAEVLRGLGLEGNQAVIVRHHDKPHAHTHLMVNRVGADGRAVSDSQSYPRTEAALRRIEQRRGLTVTPGRHAPAPDTGRRMRGDRTSMDPRQHTAPEGVRQTLLTGQSWDDIHKELAAHGWRAETVRRGRGQGLMLIGPDGQRIGAGQIDRGATLSRINQRISPRRDPTAGPAQQGQRNSIGNRHGPASARADKTPALAKPLDKLRGKKKGKTAKSQTTVAVETGVQLIGQLVTSTGGALIGSKRRKGAGLIGKTMRPGGGRGFGL